MSTITIPRETFDTMREAVIAAYAALIEAKTALYGLDGAMGKVVTTWTAIPSCESAWPRVSSTRESMDGLRAFYDVLPKKIAPIDAAFARLGPLVNAVSAAKAVQPQAQGVEPVAYAIFAENGCIRIWATEQPHLKRIAEEQGLSLVKLYTTPQEPAPRISGESESVLIDGVAYVVPMAVACELLQLHMQLKAATQQEPAAGWMPIETAPMDGTRVNLHWGLSPLFTGVTACYGHWDDDKNTNKPKPYWTHDLIKIRGVRDTRMNPPTHWMPAAPGGAS